MPARAAEVTFRPGERVFLPGASGEPTALVAAVLGARGVQVTTSFVPGVNRLTPDMIGPGTCVSGMFMHPKLAGAQRTGEFRHLPLSYAAMLKLLREQPGFDTCVIQVTPPDRQGRCSLGPAAEFTPEVLRRARRIVAVINPNTPHLPHAPDIALADCGVVVEDDAPIVSYTVDAVDATARQIALLVAGFIEDGAAVQVGLGKVPLAILQALTARSGIRLHSGMLSDGVMALAAAGALDPAWPHATTVLLGSADLYRWAAGRGDMHVQGVGLTHDPAILAGMARLVAVNSALEVDLFGQCNLEFAAGRAVSGVGGAPDFARAARLSPGGISIVAVPATFGGPGGRRSRIRARLGADAMVSLARTEVDVVVTEHGAADLRGLSVHERAAALIGVAAPEMRADLQDGWRAIADTI